MSDHHLELERPYRQGDPLDMQDAREASRRISRIRREAEAAYREAIEKRAEAEVLYRAALSRTIVRLKAEGESATAAVERARGEQEVSGALLAFRVAEGMTDAHRERLRGIEGERSQLKSLIDYSARIAAALRDHDEEARELRRAA